MILTLNIDGHSITCVFADVTSHMIMPKNVFQVTMRTGNGILEIRSGVKMKGGMHMSKKTREPRSSGISLLG